jgi:hypothetical protein
MQSALVLDHFFQPDRDIEFYNSFLLSPRSQSFSPADSGFASNDSHSPPSSLDMEPSANSFASKMVTPDFPSISGHPHQPQPLPAYSNENLYQDYPAVAPSYLGSKSTDPFMQNYTYRPMPTPGLPSQQGSMYSGWTGYEPLSWNPQASGMSELPDVLQLQAPESPPLPTKRRRLSASTGMPAISTELQHYMVPGKLPFRDIRRSTRAHPVAEAISHPSYSLPAPAPAPTAARDNPVNPPIASHAPAAKRSSNKRTVQERDEGGSDDMDDKTGPTGHSAFFARLSVRRSTNFAQTPWRNATEPRSTRP